MKFPYTDREKAVIRKLWASPVTDDAIAERLGRGRGSFRRVAERMGLPPRLFARRQSTEARRERP